MGKTDFFIIAGEASGDQQAADLVKELHKLSPGLVFRGIGGDLMRKSGVSLDHHISQFAFLGIVEIVRHLPFIRSVLNEIDAIFKNDPPRALILVDYPGFNLHVARRAKKYGIPVIYYICPQLWAWRERRVKEVRRYVDLPLVIFKFETEFFARHGVTAHFVGHPIVDQLQNLRPDEDFRARNGLHPQKKILGLFPGSRKKEVEKIFPVMVQTLQELPDSLEYQAVVGKASHLSWDVYRRFIPPELSLKIIEEGSHTLMVNCHGALVASGTATLELGFLQKPMAVLYGVAPLTYLITKRLVKIKNIALANIVAGERIVPEFIQQDMRPEKMAAFIIKLWQDEEFYSGLQKKLARIKKKLGLPGASARAADKILEFLRDENCRLDSRLDNSKPIRNAPA